MTRPIPLLRHACVAALPFLFVQPACAEWQASFATGARSVTNTEWSPAGRRLVRESGWIPGLGLQAQYRSPDRLPAVTWFGAAEGAGGNLDYRGQSLPACPRRRPPPPAW